MKSILRITIIMLLLLPASELWAANQDTLWVNGACGHCKERIEETALKLRGVLEASWDKETKILTVKTDDRFKMDRLHYRIASVGHDTKKILAHDAVYEALPACCHYRDDEPHDGEHGTSGGEHDGNRPQKVTGRLMESVGEKSQPLAGANVYWSGTTHGTVTNLQGEFEIPMEDSHYLVFSYVGYEKDSVHVHEPIALEIEFNRTNALEEVTVIHRQAATLFDLDNPFNVQDMHEKELLKAACCNLSESFETNPSVEATVTDAVTGTRQIEMLGLAGKYVQITRENMPHIRGPYVLDGLIFVPGSWIQGMQLNTGTGSVVNGFESMTGQINVELKKPDAEDRTFVNLYGSSDGMMEANLIQNIDITEQLQTSIMAHGKYQPFKMDGNGDGFLDHPIYNNGVLLNRWSFHNHEGAHIEAAVKAIYGDRLSGQTDFMHDASRGTQSAWGAGARLDRYEGWLKVGKVFDKPFTSLGFQLSGTSHDQASYFGMRDYQNSYRSLYSNLIYMSIIGNTDHQYRAGLSFQLDSYNEELGTWTSGMAAYSQDFKYNRNEIVPGAFVEYTYNHMDRFTAVSGLRYDYHSLYGSMVTPRLHLRFAPVETTVFRAMAGRGARTSHPFAEEIGMLASSRVVLVEDAYDGTHLNLDQEIAWNTGASFAQEFMLNMRKGLFQLDYYYTWFVQQVIADYDRSTDAVYFYNLDGESYSHSLQAQLNFSPLERYDMRFAYRFNDVRTTTDGTLQPRVYIPRHRAFVNMAYVTPSDWNFDMTVTWQGSKRLPNTSDNPEPLMLEEYSPDFFLWNGQITKDFGEKLEVYLGGENLLNYRQEKPILDAENPFGEFFDASMIWGPVFGRKIYAGVRVRL